MTSDLVAHTRGLKPTATVLDHYVVEKWDVRADAKSAGWRVGGLAGRMTVVNAWKMLAVLEDLALHARFVLTMLEEDRATLKKAGYMEPPAWYAPKEELQGPFKDDGPYPAGEDFENGPYPTWEEVDAAFHHGRLARLEGTLPPAKSQRIIPATADTA